MPYPRVKYRLLPLPMDQLPSGVISRPGKTQNLDANTVQNDDPGSNYESQNGSLDETILIAQGHEAVLRRSFSLLSSLGLAFEYVPRVLVDNPVAGH